MAILEIKNLHVSVADKEILKGILNLKNLKEGILYKKWGQTPFSVCITDIDIESIENKYINLMLN